MRFKTFVMASPWLCAALLLWPSAAPLAQAGPISVSPPASFAAPSSQVQPLTLEQAWQLAEAANPAFNAKRAELDAAEGRVADARAWLYNNPQLTAERTRRDVPQAGLPTERRQEWAAGLTQTLELAGQRGYRREAADAAQLALRHEIEALRQQLRVRVAQQFYRVLALQRRAALENQALTLFESNAQVIQKRRTAGADTRLDANVAFVEAERARNQLAQAQEQLLEARSDLAMQLQLMPERLPEVGDTVGGALHDGQSGRAYALSALLAASETQASFKARAARADSARAQLNLERASRYPDLTVGVSVGREGVRAARERLTTVSLSVPLPLFKRNAAGIGQALSELRQAEIEQQSGLRDTNAQLHMLWNKLVSLDARVQRLRDSVLPTLEDNLRLSEKSQRAGEIGLLEIIVVNRQALDARRDLIDAALDAQITRLELELAAGWPQEGSSQ